MDALDAGFKHMTMLASFSCDFRERVRTSLMGLVALDLASPYKATGVEVT